MINVKEINELYRKKDITYLEKQILLNIDCLI